MVAVLGALSLIAFAIALTRVDSAFAGLYWKCPSVITRQPHENLSWRYPPSCLPTLRLVWTEVEVN
jgi:hypothetical protein